MKLLLPASLTILVLIGLWIYVFQTPRTDRNWSEEFSRTATTSQTSTGDVVITNVRDWTYGDSSILSKDWRTIEVDPTKVTKVWFVTEPFSSWKAVGHTFLSFEFADGTSLSFSIEARREINEKYSATRGLFNSYELSYQWGTERDFITRRLLYLAHPVRRYPLAITPGMAQALFRGVVAQTNQLAEHPRFYNTLTENCTNTLAYIVNKTAPGTLPYDISWNLTGYADLYLMKQGFIQKVNSSPEDTRNEYDLTKIKSEVESVATTSPALFSEFLDKKLEQ